MLTTIPQNSVSSVYQRQQIIQPDTGTSSNTQASGSTEQKADTVAISREARSLAQTYQSREEKLAQRYAEEKQALEREYAQDKTRLEKEFQQKRQSLGVNMYV